MMKLLRTWRSGALQNSNIVLADNSAGLGNFLGCDLEGVNICLVEFAVVVEKGCIAILADIVDDIRDDVLYPGLHVGPGKDFAVGDFAVLVNLDHLRSTCTFIASTRSSICEVLNWKLDLLEISLALMGKMSS